MTESIQTKTTTNPEQKSKFDIPKIVLEKNGFPSFNQVQEQCLDKLQNNLVVSAPTASGKTIIAELFMLEQTLNENKKVIYTCPLRALASEHYRDFKKKYPELKFALATGDIDSSSSYLKKFDVIFTTYEKAASLLRHKAEWLKLVNCLIIDEIHELDSDRGPVLEIATTQLRNLNKNLVVLGLSATISNAKELAGWLDAKLILSNFRPVKLKQGVALDNEIEYKDGVKEDKDIEIIFDDYLKNKKQALFFLNSRKRAEGQAKKLCRQTQTILDEKDKEKLNEIAEKILDVLEQPTEQCASLAECVRKGSAFHHAGLMPKQKEIVEDNFKLGLIKSICATTTLCVVPETELWQGTVGTKVNEFDNNNSRLMALKNKKLISIRPQQVNKNYNEKKIIEIESNSGHKIRVTENHKMFVKRNNKKLFVEAKNIKKTDKIATVGKLWSARPQKYQLNFFTINNKHTKKFINPQVAYFIGAMLGDGNSGAAHEKNTLIYKSNPTIISEDEEISEEIKKVCDYLEIDCKQGVNSYGTKFVKLQKTKWLREFLVNVGVEKGQNKYICNEIKQLGRNEIKALLQGLFDTDGCIEKRGHLSFSNTSYKLIKDTQRLLLTFGIVSRIRTKPPSKIKIYGKEYDTKKSWEIAIANKQSILEFNKNIGFRIKRKQARLNKSVNKINSNTKYIECPNCNYKIYTDLFKGRTKEQKEWSQNRFKIIKLLGKEKKLFSNQIEKKLGFCPYKEKRLNLHFELIKRTRIGNQKLWELNTIGKKIYYNLTRGQEHTIHNYDFCPICRKAMNKKLKRGWRDNDFEEDIYWDFIKEKKIINEKYDFVYDISLSNKTTDNLFVANGFIIHNSAGINTPADIVFIPSLYRYGNWGMELISVREYAQMAGRSGRPKFSTEGKSIVQANSEDQKEMYLEKYLNGKLEPITSKLSNVNVLRTHVLALIATNEIYNDKSIWNFFEKTLYAKQSDSIIEIYEKVSQIIDDLIDFEFVEKKGDFFSCTKIGKRVSDLFLDPKSAFALINALKSKKSFTPMSYLFAWSNCNEFYPAFRMPKKLNGIMFEEFNDRMNEIPFKQEKLLFEENSLDIFYSATLLEKWINEENEQELFTSYGLAPGVLFGKTRVLEWLSYATIELSKVLEEDRHLISAKKLSQRIKYGVREELLPLVELKGIGRIRARKLFRTGITKPSEIKKNFAKVEQLLGKKVSEQLAKQLQIN